MRPGFDPYAGRPGAPRQKAAPAGPQSLGEIAQGLVHPALQSCDGAMTETSDTASSHRIVIESVSAII
jgi:hypothetical protein